MKNQEELNVLNSGGGIASEGFIMPINSLISYINDNVSFDYPIGTEFDTINDELFVWKYVIKTNISNSKLGVKQPKRYSI